MPTFLIGGTVTHLCPKKFGGMKVKMASALVIFSLVRTSMVKTIQSYDATNGIHMYKTVYLIGPEWSL